MILLCRVIPRALLAILALAAAVLRAQDGLPFFEAAPCPFALPPGEVEGETLACGYLYVPEDRGDPTSPSIRLAVAVIFSTDPNPPPDPIIFLEGGPGGGAISGLESWLTTPFVQKRDFILLDQRGTGYSLPSLNCPEVEQSEEGNFDAEQTCHDRLIADGINIAAYTSAESAADVSDLRLALGYNQWNVYGISYGTRLALTVLRDYPEGVRSVILDSVYPPHVNAYEQQAPNGMIAFKRLFDDCAADSVCSSAYPDLESVFYRTVEYLNAEAGSYSADDPETGEWVEYEIIGDDLVDALFEALYLTDVIPYLPLAIYTADAGDYEEAFALFEGTSDVQITAYFTDDERAVLEEVFTPEEIDAIEGWATDMTLSDEDFYTLIEETFSEEQVSVLYDVLGAAPGDFDASAPGDSTVDYEDSEGAFNSVSCREEIPFNRLEVVEIAAIAVPSPLREGLVDDVRLMFDTCHLWDVGAADARENQPVSSDVAALVLSGSYDPITPPAWAQQVAASLSRSYYFNFPGYGHGVSTSDECPASIALAFLDDPYRKPDSACLEAIVPLSFYVDEG